MKRIAAAAIVLVPFMAYAGVVEVKMKLPVKPKLQITGDEKIAIAPFIIASNGEKRNDRASKVDVQGEFQRYLRKQLTKSTKLRIVDRRNRGRTRVSVAALAAGERVVIKTITDKTGAVKRVHVKIVG